MKPITIYIDNNFNNESFEKKYKNIIEDELKKYNKKWECIKKIMKKESRYERD
jgi:chromosomal replication initiation ATPase DnaA